MPLAVMKLPMAPLCDEGHEQEQPELALAEDVEVARLQVHGQVDRRAATGKRTGQWLKTADRAASR
jgi:hypothetical protein